MEAKVLDANVKVRDTRIIRHGQEEIYSSDPNKRAASEYPIIVLYDSFLRIISPGTPTHVQGFYVKKPIFGLFGETDDKDTEIAVNLPENTTDKIIKNIINDIFVSTGDSRAQIQYQTKENYRKRGK